MFADLHLHTCYSDGTYTPQELAGHAKGHGLAAIALTDHDTVEGCGPMALACLQEGVEFIPGSELTAEINGHELHLIGYLLDIHHPRLLLETGRFQVVRQDRIREMVGRLNRLGLSLDADAVLARANCRAPGRPHVARALVEAGVCASPDEAFERFLKKHRPGWVPKFKISTQNAIELIHEAGGLAVMAHPGLNRHDELIAELAAQGLDGIECYHSAHSPSTSAHYLEIAHEHGLLVTGGSDCHGLNKGKPLIGSVQLPYIYVQQLKDRALQSLPHPVS